MQQTASKLDEQELFQLALKDSAAQRHDLAIEKLKTLLEMAPGHALAHHILAAEHAEIGLLPRAIEGFTKALQLEPTLYVACFQLGLAHYAQGDLPKAKEAWQGLKPMGDDNVFSLYGNGLLQLAEGDATQSIASLEKALTAQPDIPSLRGDIQRSLERARTQLQNPGEDKSGNVSHLLANRYGEASNTEH